MKKKIAKPLLISILVLILLLSHHSMSVYASTANDISGHWAEKIIISWQKSEKISGYEDNTFRPDNAITRAEFVHLINAMIPSEQNSEIYFKDVSKNDWFYDDISKAVSNHIVFGFEDNTFHPNDMLTRAQAAVMINNILQIHTNSSVIIPTDNNDIPEWSKNAVYAMLNQNFLCGYEDGSFGANRNMTRAETVSMLNRIEINTKVDTNQNINQIQEHNIVINKDISFTEKTNFKSAYEIYESYEQSEKHNTSTSKDKHNQTSENIITITKYNVSEFYGKTINQEVKIELEDTSIELIDVIFTKTVEVISNKQYDMTNTLFLKGTTNINHMTTFTPVTITSENNTIKTLVSKSAIKICGNTEIKNLQCYDNVNIDDSTIVTDTAEIFSNIIVNSNTKINTLLVAPNSESHITIKGIVDKLTASDKGNIASIHLDEYAHSNIIIPPFVIVENITLSQNAYCNIIIHNHAELKEFISFSKCLGSTIINYGIAENIVVFDTKTITAENVIIEQAILQNIAVISQPSNLHYKEGEILSFSDISLLLQYQNNITQIVDDFNKFNDYHIKTIPDCHTILTPKYHNQPIKIYNNDISAYTDLIQIDYKIKNTVNKQPLLHLIQRCYEILQNTAISDTEYEIDFNQYYINEIDFHLFENSILLSEQLLSEQSITQHQIEKEYTTLQKALQEFESKRLQKVVPSPILSVSNISPEYGTDDVTFTIEDVQDNTNYYYTLDNSEPTTESAEYTSPIILLPPEQTEQTTVNIKAIAVQNGFCSPISEITITYSAAQIIEDIFISDLETPFIGKQILNTISLENEQEYTLESLYWKNEEDIVEVFEADTVYTAEIILKSKKPYIFKTDILPILKEIENTKINSILIDEQRSDSNFLYILVHFKATPSYPTEEMAKNELEKITIDTLSVTVPYSERENEQYCSQATSESACQLISEYWNAEFDLIFILPIDYNLTVVSGQFTITSIIDDSVSITNENNIDINIDVMPDDSET
ncbi:S-layer homology domain-containing protein [Lachnospiraceae bacterium 46-61]